VALGPMLEKEFLSREGFLEALKSRLPGDSLEPMRDLVTGLSHSRTPFRIGAPIQPATYAVTSLAALMFIIAGLFLGQLSKLKAGPFELEKTSAEAVSTSGTQVAGGRPF